MKILIAAFAALFLAAGGARAETGCRLKTDAAILCTTARNAAQAFRNYAGHRDLALAGYTRAMLKRARCFSPAGTTYEARKIEEADRGRIALADGWVEVALLVINDKDDYFVATGYLTGVCKKSAPVVEKPVPLDR